MPPFLGIGHCGGYGRRLASIAREQNVAYAGILTLALGGCEAPVDRAALRSVNRIYDKTLSIRRPDMKTEAGNVESCIWHSVQGIQAPV